MYNIRGPHFSSIVFLAPALGAAIAGEIGSAAAKHFLSLALGTHPRPDIPEPEWATRNEIAFELATLHLRDFSVASAGVAALICAPYALHGATVADFAPGHSLVERLRAEGLARLFVTDWHSATPDMRFLSIDNYLADLNVVVDELGGVVDLIGLCQGGWLALVYAARFPQKVRKLVLAGTPVDIAAGDSALSTLASTTPISLFEHLVALGRGRMLGYRVLDMWAREAFDTQEIYELLQPTSKIGTPAFHRLERRFRDWYAWTVDLPGCYYLQMVKQLYKENRLATGRLVALGKRIELQALRSPMFLLAGEHDELIAPAQMFAAAALVSPQVEVRRMTAPCRHLGLFMGRGTLSSCWPQIARWLAEPVSAAPASSARNETSGGPVRAF